MKAILLYLSLGVAACSAPAAVPTHVPPENPFAWAQDGFFPAPSNHYLRDGRIQYNADVWGSRVLSKAPTVVETSLARLAQRNGFSPNLPIIVAAPRHVKVNGLPGESIRLVDVADGSTVGLDIDVYPLDDEGPLTMLMLLPSVRLLDGHTYLVVVSDLKDDEGKLLPKAPLVAARWAGADAAVVETRNAVAKYVPTAAVERVQQAFTFTIGTNLYGDFERLKGQIDTLASKRPLTFKHTPPQNHFWFLASFPGGRGAEILGQMNGWRFVGDKGEILARPTPRKWQILISLPEACPPGGCPVVVFGHGLQASKETMLQIAGPLNQKGIIVVGVDGLWHEHLNESVHVTDGIRKSYDMFSGLIYQHVSLQWQVIRMVQTELRKLDVLPLTGADGMPDIDAERIGYIGQSLGGISGVSVMAFEPAVDGAIFNVTGGGMYNMFSKSMLKWMLRVPMLTIPGLEPVDGFKASAFASMANDYIDPLMTGGRLTTDPRPKLLQVGLDDGLVPNVASDTLARTWGLEYIGEPIPGKAIGVPVRKDDRLIGGYTFASWGVGGFFHHLALNSEKQVGETVRFFTEVLKPVAVETVAP